eukprot:Plantae.Rhodophyta-Purpureofilum_apyrenoidigerum.ctg53739.p1 GENE.Plantae.Rhodophyta-Purpureofilum_apyrenoidigerum.ctg53739~~Plantae.Rhodophyta-Purpureofilum_apyrenoidigerum.ctg53739.p1  ORF type:complete len:397 (-),score=62.17 Plantae.Rhodophyta-Purpureofilum_apyrenoidigerum.ctg53739:160-1278(-)
MAGLGVLAVTILVHEAGHFLAARSRGIRVENFSVGFGPKILSYKPKNSETEFTLRGVPLGGFVAFPNPNAPATAERISTAPIDPEDPSLLQNRPIGDRALVLSAGVIANIILAWSSLFVSTTAFGVPSINFQEGALVTKLADENGNAARAGMQAGDVILRVNGEEIKPCATAAADVAGTIRNSNGRMMRMEVRRGNEILNMKLHPKLTANGESVLGIQLRTQAEIVRQRPDNMSKAIEITNNDFIKVTKNTWHGLSSLVTNFKQNAGQVAGPVGVVSMGADLAKNDSAALLAFCADISINLAIMNSLPLPALDGGQMFFLIAEAARGSPVSSKVQNAVNQTAIFMFLAFSGFLLFGDIEKLKLLQGLQHLLG